MRPTKAQSVTTLSEHLGASGNSERTPPALHKVALGTWRQLRQVDNRRMMTTNGANQISRTHIMVAAEICKSLGSCRR